MIITLSGYPGSGKSTVAKYLAKKFNMERYSMGDMKRKMASDMGMTIDEFNKLCEKESWSDDKVDSYQEKLGKKEDNFIIDGRLSWHFIPQSVKIYLSIDLDEGAKRIFENPRESETRDKSLEDVKKRIKKRVKSDEERFKKLYGIKLSDLSNYDIIIDTTKLSPDQMNKEVERAIKKFNSQ